jgi:hypothetical protein
LLFCRAMFSLAKHRLRRQRERLSLFKPHLQPQADELPNLFEHKPLDLDSSSIRLIQICQGPNVDDRIRCNLRLASTDTEYTCLSYVWGEEGIGDWIYVDGKRFIIRQNLLDFLQSARRVPELASKWLWIDALCIDQTNFPERQHQVQQMGRIYSGAKEVISWLGTNKDIAILFGQHHGNWNHASGLYALSQSQYWQRAWVVQEILLGRHVKLMADVYMQPLDALPPYHITMPEKWTTYGMIQTRTLPMRELLQHPQQSGVTLIHLLYFFRFQSCHVPRDRIFSLLGLCREGTNLKVDYSISHHDLALRVLASCIDSFCLCAIRIVYDALFDSTQPYYARELQPTTYSSITLPIIWTESEDCGNVSPDESHSITVCNDQGIGSSEVCKIRIMIDLHHLCSMYQDQLVIKVCGTRVTVICLHFLENGEKEAQAWLMPDGGMVLQSLDEGRTCRILFTLGFWFHFLQSIDKYPQFRKMPILADTCCPRITNLHNQSPEKSCMPTLGLLSITQPVDEYFKVHSNIPGLAL